MSTAAVWAPEMAGRPGGMPREAFNLARTLVAKLLEIQQGDNYSCLREVDE